MNSLTLSRCALSVCAAATLLVGCSGLQPAGVTQGPVSQGQMPEAENASPETVLHSFGAYPNDGANPVSGLTYLKGTLYGTTSGGGAYCPSRTFFEGCGTVYSVTPSGTETVLHSFTGGKDGARPYARLILLNGTLYGTTLVGGSKLIVSSSSSCAKGYYEETGFGTVFSITPSGKETIVHTFVRFREGAWPTAPLLNVNGTMYGTTCGGGSIPSGGGEGIAFTITPSGNYQVFHRFKGTEGGPGYGRLVDLNGTLYDTTDSGGKYFSGAVFSLSTTGKEKLLHSFNENGLDGFFPGGGLVAVKQTLYGTTFRGGAYDDGTVFSITPTGTETVLHSFDGVDGNGPQTKLLNVNGTLYGTTREGGNLKCGCGTVFEFDIASGRERVIYSFKGGKDGASPRSGVVEVNGVLYGTTSNGGGNGCNGTGCGTVYSVKL